MRAVNIPASELEFGVRRGKLSFTWKQLKQWIVPPLPRSLAEHDALAVDLPLAEVAPLFMARQTAPKGRQAASALTEIPDIFSGISRPVSSDSARIHSAASTATVVASSPAERRVATQPNPATQSEGPHPSPELASEPAPSQPSELKIGRAHV